MSLESSFSGIMERPAAAKAATYDHHIEVWIIAL